VVRRLIGPTGGIALTFALSAVTLLAFAQPAGATNTRVSISNFAWSTPRVDLDLGEKVTWDWIGPDLAHSVTGISPNALQWDSDPTTDAPSHQPGDSYTLQFTQPGVYVFQCKLHSVVRGEVIVSPTPGDPNSDPGPQAPLNLDLKRPTLGGVALKRTRFRGKRGIATSARISERGTLDAEYYRLRPGGKRTYNGYQVDKTFIGINHLKLGARGKHFKASPASYEVVLRALDLAANPSKPVRKRFTIVPGKRRS
jgi:plastocyanin